jgi:hypothetical protein
MGVAPHIATRPRIRRANVSDIGRIARLFTASFARDPVFDWLARTGKSRDSALERFFRWTIRERSLPHGETWMTEDGLAAAVWIPPYSEASDPTFLRFCALPDCAGCRAASPPRPRWSIRTRRSRISIWR